MTAKHLSPEQIALLAGGSSDDALLRHARSCDECRRAVLDAGSYSVQFEQGQIPDHGPGVADIASSLGRPKKNQTRRTLVVGMFSLVAAVAIWSLWKQPTPNVPGSNHVIAAIEEFTRSSWSVLPGGESVADILDPARRGGTDGETAADELASMASHYSKTETSPAYASRLVAGYLATDRIKTARTYIDDARVKFPADQTLLLLEAQVLLFEGNASEAVELLAPHVENNPRNALAAINLAVMLSRSERVDEARTLLKRIRDSGTDQRLSDRARLILGEL